MNENNCKARVIFPSTRLIYKGNDKSSLDEKSEKDAKTIYALNKLHSEKIKSLTLISANPGISDKNEIRFNNVNRFSYNYHLHKLF